ncbi:MAG: phenylalanine--tRNA ligase subunit beta [Pseudomonadota bacterium]|nr:phenylalanine--tRNA ligase subunit beta [Pseudomonadota bacterium]
MKFTLNWLKDHLDTSAPLDKITQTLTMIGLEVEAVTDRSADLNAFTVAKILHAEPHPQADKLRVCRVESDIGELQIVCGAPNARAGIHVVLAKEGAVIPANGMVIKKTKIRGVESNGMLCSAEELALPGDSSGIIELPATAKIGESIVGLLGLDDPVIEVAITPNRADALGVRGIARDLAAAGLDVLKPLPVPSTKHQAPSTITVTLATPHCPQFIGCTIRGVKNGQSPDWLRKRLEATGQKPISALVDITNYITIDLDRPLHVFDAKKLRGNLIVRDARDGETLKALNGKEYALSEGMTVIADDSGVLSLGGIIGGEESGCTEATTDVFLEVALFDPAHIAQTGRKLGIESDARYRFERGVDPAFVETGAKIAIHMIQELCGGETSQLVCAGKTPEWKRSITFNPERVKTLGGVAVAADESKRILTSLGFTVDHTVTPPSWRSDIEGEADLVEEILRIHGYDHIPATPLPMATIGKPSLPLSQKRAQTSRRILASRGMLEACTWSFLPEAQAKLFGGGDPKLKLINPISADLDTMRPSLLTNLLTAAKKNTFRGFKNLGLFEVGLQFHDVTPDDGQRLAASGIRTGHIAENSYKDGLFQHHERMADAFDAKGDMLAVLEALGLTKFEITAHAPSWYHPGRSGALMLGKTVLGYFGEVHPALLPAFDIEGRAVAFELFLDALPTPRAKGKARPPLKLSDYQAVERDFAFMVDEKIPAADIIKTLAQADKQLITDIAIFDVYAGTGVEAGKKSVAIRVTLQAMDRTLSEQDIAGVSQAIIAAAAKEFGGQLRQ